jgi:nicotinate-nucleotide pyrophosphorylase (carboxylating)
LLTDISKDYINSVVQNALQEDVGDGEVTTLGTVTPDIILQGKFIAKEDGFIAGLDVARQTFTLVDRNTQFTPAVSDGEQVTKGQIIATVQGPGQALLSGERVALNFLQRMSGIATLTARFVEAVKGTQAVILDTRKTVPGLRLLDKWAVKVGGGQNHRIGLYDMALIKENHIAAVGGITAAVQKVREFDQQGRAIEVEVQNLTELREALQLKVDGILLDNMSLTDMSEATCFASRVTLKWPVPRGAGVFLCRDDE